MVKKELKAFSIDAAKRAVYTVAQTALGFITVGSMVTDINWVEVASVSLVAGIVSVLTSVVRWLAPKKKEDE